MQAAAVLYFRAGSDHAEVCPLAELATRFAPRLLQVTRKAGATAHRGAAMAPADPLAQQTFGFRWFAPELLRHKTLWADILTASLAIQVLGLAMPLMTQVVIDKVLTHHTMSTLTLVAGAMVLCIAFTAFLNWMRQYLVLHTGTRVDAVLAQRVMRHLLRLPMPYFEHRPTGNLVARMQGIEHIRQFVSGAAVTLLLDCPFLLVFLAIMAWYSWQLTAVAAAILAAITLLSIAITPRLRKKLNHQFQLGARNQAFVTEYTQGIETVKTLQLEPQLRAKYEHLVATYTAANFDTRLTAATTNTVTQALEQTMTLAVLIGGALMVIHATNSAATGGPAFTIGMLVAFQMFAARLSQPVLRIAGLWQEYQEARIAVERLADLMDMPAEPHQPNQKQANRTITPAITLDNLSFQYSPQHPKVIDGLTLTIKPGKLTLITGPSGCGKSTLAKLLQGFYPASGGAIRIDNTDIRAMAVNQLRAHFGVVPQETTLFAGTLHDNLANAHPSATFDDITEACRHAGIHDTISQLPQGYQTTLGEHGNGLSGGQRQRVAIARALLKRPGVLIFDEATSSLDAETAEQFAHTVNQLKGAVTIVFIAHAVPVGLAVDKVWRLDAPIDNELDNSSCPAA